MPISKIVSMTLALAICSLLVFFYNGGLFKTLVIAFLIIPSVFTFVVKLNKIFFKSSHDIMTYVDDNNTIPHKNDIVPLLVSGAVFIVFFLIVMAKG
jgi:archaellum biogenesis protein FlaJ (TadC family)